MHILPFPNSLFEPLLSFDGRFFRSKFVPTRATIAPFFPDHQPFLSSVLFYGRTTFLPCRFSSPLPTARPGRVEAYCVGLGRFHFRRSVPHMFLGALLFFFQMLVCFRLPALLLLFFLRLHCRTCHFCLLSTGLTTPEAWFSGDFFQWLRAPTVLPWTFSFFAHRARFFVFFDAEHPPGFLAPARFLRCPPCLSPWSPASFTPCCSSSPLLQ